MLARLRTIWRALRRRSRWEHDLEEELQSHVDRRAEDLVRAGLSPQEALRRARLDLGARESYREQCREAHGLRWPDELVQDLRYALRALRRSPGFAGVAVLSLALGVGANTVVFSVVNALVLKSLPVSEPDRLAFIQSNHGPSHSFPNYRDLRDRNTTFAGVVAYRIAPMGLETGGGAVRVWGYLATGNYFDVLGAQPHLGRFFRPEDDRQPGASPFAVLSYTCWQNRFAADSQIVGRTIRINSLPYTVLGVAPRGFQGTELFYWPEIWVPMMMQPQIESFSWLDSRGNFNTWILGCLRPGVTPQQAEANLNAIAAALAKEFPANNEGLRLTLAKPGLIGDALRRPAEAFVAGVMALAALVLLAACVNLASLLAARTADRHRELAIRASIGAGRGRIVRQLLTEALVLSLAGGAAGCALAVVLLRLINQWRAPLDFPVSYDFSPDWRVFAFALALSLLTGVLFGIAPARQAWRADPNQALKDSPSIGTHGRRWAVRDLLLAAQVALCCVLITACFLSLRGLARALETPLGFDPRGVSVVGFDLHLARYSQESGRSFQRRALDAIAGLPGVTAAAYANSVPLSINQSATSVFPEEADDSGRTRFRGVAYYNISPGYLRAMGTRLLAGRDFTWRDDAGAPSVAIVNETFARQVIGRPDATGRRFRYGRGGPLVEVVGVVEDGKYTSLTEQPRRVVFRPALQSYSPDTVLVVRSSLPEDDMAAQMRRAVAALDPGLPLHGVGSIAQMLGFAFFPTRAASVALSAFGVLAVMLAATGIYGVAAYAVSRRVREIGIRVAMGARPWQILRFVLGRTIFLLAAGSGLGLAVGVASGRVLSSVVYEASARDPLVIAAALVAMMLIGVAASLAPTRRALSIDPLRALRHE